jgi:Leucine-rich repeat (LRR) protein
MLQEAWVIQPMMVQDFSCLQPEEKVVSTLVYKLPTSLPKLLSRIFINLKYLDVSGASVLALPFDLGDHTPALSTLNAGFNKLKGVDGCRFPKDLAVLLLHCNKLGQPPDNILSQAHLQTLNWDRNNLKSLDLGDGTGPALSSISTLYLNSNQLSHLPDTISHFVNLAVLNVTSNRLERLPKSLSALRKLEVLQLSSNRLREVPEEIGSLSSLRVLNLAGNCLATLPPEMGHLSALQELRLDQQNPVGLLGLRHDLGTNLRPDQQDGRASWEALEGLEWKGSSEAAKGRRGLEREEAETGQRAGEAWSVKPGGVSTADQGICVAFVLPKSLEGGGLRSLQALSCAKNGMESIPPWVCSLPKLKLLNFDQNRITSLPLEPNLGLPELEYLSMNNNRLTALPDWLMASSQCRTLLVAHNDLNELPATLSEMTRLQVLDLEGNKSVVSPESTEDNWEVESIESIPWSFEGFQEEEIAFETIVERTIEGEAASEGAGVEEHGRELLKPPLGGRGARRSGASTPCSLLLLVVFVIALLVWVRGASAYPDGASSDRGLVGLQFVFLLVVGAWTCIFLWSRLRRPPASNERSTGLRSGLTTGQANGKAEAPILGDSSRVPLVLEEGSRSSLAGQAAPSEPLGSPAERGDERRRTEVSGESLGPGSDSPRMRGLESTTAAAGAVEVGERTPVPWGAVGGGSALVQNPGAISQPVPALWGRTIVNSMAETPLAAAEMVPVAAVTGAAPATTTVLSTGAVEGQRTPVPWGAVRGGSALVQTTGGTNQPVPAHWGRNTVNSIAETPLAAADMVPVAAVTGAAPATTTVLSTGATAFSVTVALSAEPAAVNGASSARPLVKNDFGAAKAFDPDNLTASWDLPSGDDVREAVTTVLPEWSKATCYWPFGNDCKAIGPASPGKPDRPEDCFGKPVQRRGGLQVRIQIKFRRNTVGRALTTTF